MEALVYYMYIICVLCILAAVESVYQRETYWTRNIEFRRDEYTKPRHAMLAMHCLSRGEASECTCLCGDRCCIQTLSDMH